MCNTSKKFDLKHVDSITFITLSLDEQKVILRCYRFILKLYSIMCLKLYLHVYSREASDSKLSNTRFEREI